MNGLLLLAIAAYDPSSVAVGAHHLMVGADVMQESGGLPSSLASEGEFDRYTTYLHFRGGVTDAEPNTKLGTQLGFEYELRVGFTPEESKELNDTVPLAFSIAAGLSMRTFTFQVPFLGMVVPHLSAEFAAGGAHWWSDTVRFAMLGGVRVAVGSTGDLGLEADYTVVPFVVSGAPGDLKVRHLEHRIAISIGAGPVGLAVWLRFSRQRWKLPEDEEFSTTTGRALGVGLEWRP